MEFSLIDLNESESWNDEQRNETIKFLRNICEMNGCFYLKSPQVNKPLIDNVFEQAKTFFHLPIDEKEKIRAVECSYIGRGYFPFESNNIHAFMGRPNYPCDAVEILTFGPMDQCSYDFDSHVPAEVRSHWGINQWPRSLSASFQQTLQDFQTRLTSIANELMVLFSLSLHLDPNYFSSRCVHGPHTFNANFYPIVRNIKPNQCRCAPHRDANLFTLMVVDDNPESLMAKHANGSWGYVNPPQDSIFVNLGDSMARWTNDIYISTEHQVAWPKRLDEMNERLSVGLFVKANYDTLLGEIPYCIEKVSPKYELLTYNDYFKSKIDALREILKKQC